MREASDDKRIVIIQGDITEQDCDAVVNVANDRLWMGGGVAGAIKRKGGEDIEKEAVSRGPIPLGNAVVARAGRLKPKEVIQAITKLTGVFATPYPLSVFPCPGFVNLVTCLKS